MKLSDWIQRTPGASRREIREACGVSRQAVHAWINGIQTPRLEHILRLRDLTNGEVGIDDFVESKPTETN